MALVGTRGVGRSATFVTALGRRGSVRALHPRREDHDAHSAALNAGATRLRPVLMTSAATVFGHLPLVLVSGPGAAARNSIGMVLVTGMTVGTLFTLFVVPVFYSLIAAQHQPSREPEGTSLDAEDEELLTVGART